MKKQTLLIIGASLSLIATAGLVIWPALKRRKDSVRCGNQMHAVLYAVSAIWAGEHDGYLPTNFHSMSNDLIFPPLILVCPADQSKHPVENWTSFSAQNHSYEIVNPGIPKTDTNRVFLRCPIHGYTGYADNRLLDPSGQLVRKRSW